MTPAQLAQELRSAAARAPKEVEAAMREGGMLLAGPLIQDAIAATDPLPVDRAQYKASWSSQDVPGGAVVSSSAKQAVWIERGRGPGPVPLAPIRDWVLRKGIARGPEAEGVARAIRRKIETQGYAPRRVLARAYAALRAPLRRIVSEHMDRAFRGGAA